VNSDVINPRTHFAGVFPEFIELQKAEELK
jgi:hypothetical protein